MKKIIYATIIIVFIIGLCAPIVNVVKRETTAKPSPEIILAQIHGFIGTYTSINDAPPKSLIDLYTIDDFSLMIEKLKEIKFIQSLNDFEYVPSPRPNEALLKFTRTYSNGAVKTYVYFSDGMVKVIK
jgi:hypothetical protein